jgi:hypothetical protein
MKIKLLVVFLLIFFCLNIGLAQDEEVQYAKLKNIDYSQFEGRLFKKVLENDTLKGYVTVTLFADKFHGEFPYICLQYTKAKFPYDAVLVKVYLKMKPKEIKQIFKERSYLNLKKYANFKINRIVLFYPEKVKLLASFSAEVGSRAIDTALWNNMDTNLIRKSLDKPLSFLLQDKLFGNYKAYTFGERYLTLYYGEYLFFEIYFNKTETNHPYLYKDVLNLWTMAHLTDEKIQSIKVDISGKKHQILYFR